MILALHIEIAARRNPENYREEMVACWVDKEGVVNFKTKKRYIRW